MALPEVPLRKELYSSRQEAGLQKQLASLPETVNKIIVFLQKKDSDESKQKTKSLDSTQKQYDKINDINSSLRVLTDSQELTNRLLKDIFKELKAEADNENKADNKLGNLQSLKGFGGNLLKKLLLGGTAAGAVAGGMSLVSSFFDKETNETETETNTEIERTETSRQSALSGFVPNPQEVNKRAEELAKERYNKPLKDLDIDIQNELKDEVIMEMKKTIITEQNKLVVAERRGEIEGGQTSLVQSASPIPQTQQILTGFVSNPQEVDKKAEELAKQRYNKPLKDLDIDIQNEIKNDVIMEIKANNTVEQNKPAVAERRGYEQQQVTATPVNIQTQTNMPETATPIRYNGEVVGYMLEGGRITPIPGKEDVLRQAQSRSQDMMQSSISRSENNQISATSVNNVSERRDSEQQDTMADLEKLLVTPVTPQVPAVPVAQVTPQVPAVPVAQVTPQVPAVSSASQITATPVVYNEALEKYKAEELAQVQPGSGGGAQAEALMQAEQRAQRETGFKPEVTRVELTPTDIQQRQQEQQVSEVAGTRISEAFERRASRTQVDETSNEFKTLKEQTLTQRLEEEQNILGRRLLASEQADIESQVTEEVRNKILQQSAQSPVAQTIVTPPAVPAIPVVQPITPEASTAPQTNVAYTQLLEKYKAEELAQIQPGSGGGAQAEAVATAEQRAQKETGFKPEATRIELTPTDIQQRQEEVQRDQSVTSQISSAFERRASRTQVDETSNEFKTLKEQKYTEKLTEEESILGRKLLASEQAELETQAVEEVRKIIQSKSDTIDQVQAPPPIIPQTPQAQSEDILPKLIDRLKVLSRKIENPDEKTITRLENITRMLQEKDYETASAAIERLEKQFTATDTDSRDVLRQRFESISGSRSSAPGQRRSSMEDGSYQVASAAQTTMTDATYIPETAKDDLASSNRPSFMNTITSVQQAPSASPNVSGPGPAPTADKIDSAEGGKPTSEKPENVRVASTANVDKIDKDLLGRFYAAAKEYGKPVTITSGFRDDEKQAELWVRANVFREPGIYMPAKPDRETTINYRGQTFKVPGGRTRSSHGGSSPTATAIDISRADADAMDSMGLFAKYGLNRPFPNDPVHIQKKGGTATPHVEEPATPQEVQATQVKSESVTTATGPSGESDAEGGVATPMQGEQTTATGGAGASGPAATMTPGAPSSGAAALTASVGNEVAKRTPAESAPPISPETPSTPNAGAGDTSYSSSTSDPGNVEPADAATRYRELFGLMAA